MTDAKPTAPSGDDRRPLVQREREALADSLLRVGEHAPTLCEGWDARALAHHLVLREGDPRSLVRLARTVPALRALPAAGGRRPFADLVATFRAGPPLPMRLPGLDALVNTAEHFVHHEDVRRAQPGWTARLLDPRDEQALWGSAQVFARRGLRGCPVGVVLVVPDGPRSKVRRGTPAVVLTGPASELLLHVSGRRAHADVAVSGPDDAVAAYRRWAGLA